MLDHRSVCQCQMDVLCRGRSPWFPNQRLQLPWTIRNNNIRSGNCVRYGRNNINCRLDIDLTRRSEMRMLCVCGIEQVKQLQDRNQLQYINAHLYKILRRNS